MSSRPGALQEQYNKQIPDPADQSGYRATVETQRQDFVGADPAIERQEGTKLYPRPEDVQTWETEKQPDPAPGQGKVRFVQKIRYELGRQVARSSS
ncbi:hypothetical protein EV714DRAFT_282371 [Schizophyllum commune]